MYWTYVDYLHAHGDEITGPDRNLQKSFAALDRVALQEGTLGKLDGAKLNACIAKQDETPIRASLKEAEGLGLDGTPELFVNGERINGAVPEDQLWAVIDRALRAQGETPPPMPAPRARQAGRRGIRRAAEISAAVAPCAPHAGFILECRDLSKLSERGQLTAVDRARLSGTRNLLLRKHESSGRGSPCAAIAIEGVPGLGAGEPSAVKPAHHAQERNRIAG